MVQILRYIFYDIIKNRSFIIYTLLLALMTTGIFLLDSNIYKNSVTLINAILLLVPLFTLIFTTIYLYNSVEFIELILSQPVRRRDLWVGLWGGINGAYLLGLFAGIFLPLLFLAPLSISGAIAIITLMLSAIFVSISFLAASLTRDKSRGLGLSIILWLFFVILFDGLILFLLFQFADYPVENWIVGLLALSPVDLARIFILVKLGASDMLGFAGALFRENYGSGTGSLMIMAIAILWIAVPFLLSLRVFNKKDL